MATLFDLSTYISQLERLVNVDCGSHTPAGISKIADIVTPMFEQIGFTVIRHQLNPNAGPCWKLRISLMQRSMMLCSVVIWILFFLRGQ